MTMKTLIQQDKINKIVCLHMKVFLFHQRTSAVFFSIYNTRYWKHIQYVTVSVREEIQTELVYHLKLVVYPYILSSEYANIYM